MKSVNGRNMPEHCVATFSYDNIVRKGRRFLFFVTRVSWYTFGRLNCKHPFSMTDKQKIGAGIGIALLIVSFIFLYRQFSTRDVPVSVPLPFPAEETQNGSASGGSNGSEMSGGSLMKKIPAPETPDDIVDDIVENDADISILDEESVGETSAAVESVQTIDDITNAYDEQQL